MFDTVCKRLERMADIFNTIEMFSGLSEVKIDGIDVICVKYKTIVENAKKKNYNILDHRKAEVTIVPLSVDSWLLQLLWLHKCLLGI